MELLRALGVLCEAPTAEHTVLSRALGLPEAAPADWTDAFLAGAPPYASIYVGAEGMIGGEARDRVAGFWRALGLTPPAEPDHLASLLSLYTALAEAQAQTPGAGGVLRGQARHALLAEHLLPWSGVYLGAIERIAGRAYRAWAALLGQALAHEAAQLQSPYMLSAHLRAAPGLPGPEAGLDELIDALLTPVRTGLILTRADLATAARALGVGIRLGERRAGLRDLIGQDAGATLRWLAARAEEAAHADAETGAPAVTAVADFWRTRAGAAAALLHEAAAGVPSVERSG